MVAGNVWNAGVVLGAPVTDWAVLELAQMTACLSIKGRAIGNGKGSDVMGHPLNALAWHTGKLAAVGTPLRQA
jgi:2-keto-4-pentenoate hydratase